MNLVKDDQALRTIWEDRVKAAEVHPDGVRGYCLQERIASSRLYYWRNKFKATATANETAPNLGSFIVAEIAETVSESVEIVPSASHSKPAVLPDPKWLAAFATELIRGLQA